MSWLFTLLSTDVDRLKQVSDDLQNEFDVDLGTSIEVHEDGREITRQTLSVTAVGAFSLEEVKLMAARIEAVAEREGVICYNVTCFDADMFGWLDLDAATWRLRHLTDSGLEEGAPLPWVFAVKGTVEQLNAMLAVLDNGLYKDAEIVEEEAGTAIMLLNADGRNDEGALTDRYQAIQAAANTAQVAMEGVQFFNSEDAEGANEAPDL